MNMAASTVIILFLIAANMLWSVVAAQEVKLQCLPYERIECGCAIALVNVECRSDQETSRYHLFFGLSDGAPLLLNVDGQQISIPSIRGASQTFSFSRGNRWTEKYHGHGRSVTIHFTPGKDTCIKAAPERCEYFDVSATVRIEHGSSRTQEITGTGICGC